MKDKEIYLNAPEAATPVELAAYLDEACGGDAELRGRMEALFVNEAADTAFMKGGVGRAGGPATEQSGSVIGKYRLLQQIGEGGFGTVWMAEQLEPVRRRVAFKIIKAGMDTKNVVARFEQERQALAVMDHPNIAQVYDAGSTETGRPFFAMELVKGIPVTRFCDEQKLGTRERLELFADICSAINHAHQKGIIHRDIKPSNVLVTLHGGRAVPKVIDFGIAKATQAPLTELTLVTEREQFVGTPAYMSPEQTTSGGLDVDTRSDIYALGVLLYELLTGSPPFDPKTLLAAGYDEMRRIIREVEPPRPSARLSTIAGEQRTAIAKVRHVAPERIGRLVEPDLDWIVMKAIEKDRTRRYETANAFAMDIGHFLRDEEVSASPPSAGYRLRKFARRHKGALRAAAVITLLLVAGTVTSTLLAIRATHAEQEVAKQLELVKKERDATMLARGDLGEVLRVLIGIPPGSPEKNQKEDDVNLALLRDRITLMEGIFERMKKRNGLRDTDTLWVMGSLASLLETAGEQDRAVQLREEAARVSRDYLGAEHRDALGAKARLAAAYEKANRLDDAAKLREELLPVLEKVRGPAHSDTTAVRFALLKQYEKAGGHDRDIVRLRSGMLNAGTEKHGAESIPTLHLRHNLAAELNKSGQKEEGLRRSRETLAVARGLPPSPDNAMFLRYSVWCLAWHCGENKLTEEAERLNAELKALHPKLRPVRSVAIAKNAQWKWHHPGDGADPEKTTPGFHKNFPLPGFDDSKWNASAMQGHGFGYGKGFAGVDIGLPPDGKRRTAYFRCHFTTVAPLKGLELRARRDDGLIAYLDGKEIVRDNVSDGPDAWKLDALQGVNEDEIELTMVWPLANELPAGDHVLAISLHNIGGSSSDLRLSGVTLVEPEAEQ